MKLTVFAAAAVGSLMALVGFAGAATASATVDLIWIDVSETNAQGKPICLFPSNRNCPPDPRSLDGGVTLSSAAVTDNITLGVILTAGPNTLMGAGLSVNYGDALENLSVVQFRSLTTTLPLPYLPSTGRPPTHQPPYIDNINAWSGIGLLPGETAYLGTVTFHKDSFIDGLFEITVGSDGSGCEVGVYDFGGYNISDTTTFNSAYLVDGGTFPTPTPTATPPGIPPPGSVVDWGVSKTFDRRRPPNAINGVAGTATEIAAGGGHSCAIQAGTGEVVCWGVDYYCQATPPDAVNGVSGTATNITAGGDHSCAIQAGTGIIVCWGQPPSLHDFGQIIPPDAVNGVAGTATEIAAGGEHSCAIQAGTGKVVCWGNDVVDQATPPDAVNGVSGSATAIAAGYLHSCAIQAGTGGVVCWGQPWAFDYGQATPPDAVNGVSGTATAIAAGSFHSCAIRASTDEVVCWGDDREGQATPPDTVNGVSGSATAIAAGYLHSCAIQAGTGEVVCWGNDVVDQATPPDAVNGVSGTATVIAAGSYHSLAIAGVPSDCLCEVQNINPNQVVLQNVATGGKGSGTTRKMVMTLNAVDAPGATCDRGEFSEPTSVNLKIEDDSGNILIDSAETVVCEQGVTTNLKRDVFFQSPLNCENGAVPPPKPDFSLGTITSTGSAPGTADYVESTRIKCFE